MTGGDFLFLASCGEIVPSFVRERFRRCLVIHASDLPRDRGWSPHVWAILEGADEITVSLLDAADPVDSGAIWHQERFSLTGTETFDEINSLLFATELRLMDWAVANCSVATPRQQSGATSYRQRRTPADSRVLPEQTIAEVFDLMRVCDPERFPAFFKFRGACYTLTMRRADNQAAITPYFLNTAVEPAVPDVVQMEPSAPPAPSAK